MYSHATTTAHSLKLSLWSGLTVGQSIQALCAISLTLWSDLFDTSCLSSDVSAGLGDDRPFVLIFLLIAWWAGVGKIGEEIEIAQVTLADD